jgi:hypothetical protein
MKNIFLGLALCLVQILPLSSRAADVTESVTYAEVIFGCNGSNANTNVTPGLNVADRDGEVRVQGLGSAYLALEGSDLILNTPYDQNLVIGTLTSAPSCDVEDTGEDATANWNSIALSKMVIMNLSHSDQQYTLTVTDLGTEKEYQFSW